MTTTQNPRPAAPGDTGTGEPFDPAAVIAVAVERAAFGAPGPDGRPTPETMADVEAILGLLAPGGPPPAAGEDARPFEPGPLRYAADWDEGAHPRETKAHDGRRPGEFAPSREGGAAAGPAHVPNGAAPPTPAPPPAPSGTPALHPDHVVARRLAADGAGRAAVDAYRAALAASPKVKKAVALAAKMEALKAGPMSEAGRAADMTAYQRAIDEYIKAQKAHIAADRAAKAEARRLLKEHLTAEAPAALAPRLTPGLSRSQEKATAEATAFLSGLVGRDPGPFDVQDGEVFGRSHYSSPEPNKPAEVWLGGKADAGVAVHEIGHHINEDAQVKALCQVFLAGRTAGEQAVSLATQFPELGYGKDETGLKDDFDKLYPDDANRAYYTGKSYADGQTELISMGAELLYRDPAGFLERDPEYFHFVTGIIRGTLV